MKVYDLLVNFSSSTEDTLILLVSSIDGSTLHTSHILLMSLDEYDILRNTKVVKWGIDNDLDEVVLWITVNRILEEN